jgi:hypothetical protein
VTDKIIGGCPISWVPDRNHLIPLEEIKQCILKLQTIHKFEIPCPIEEITGVMMGARMYNGETFSRAYEPSEYTWTS